MTVSRSDERPYAEVRSLGVVVMAVPPLDHRAAFGLHSGLLYRVDDGGPRISHLAWHFDLRDEPANDPYLWADVGLDEDNSRMVAAWLYARHNSPSDIPYGIDSAGACFDKTTQEFIPPPLGKGLTCSTYIVAVLKHLGFSLLLESSWPADRQEDHSWQQAVIDKMKEGQASAEYVASAEKDVGAKRYRPAEVVGAATLSSPWPVTFVDAASVAQSVIQDVERALAKQAAASGGPNPDSGAAVAN